jgi:two-component system, NtrC family, sensor kinase
MKQLLVVCMLWLGIYNPAFTQVQARVDSLKYILEKATADSIKALTLYELWWAYAYTKPETGKIYLDQSLRLSREINFVKGEAKALQGIGATYYFSGNYTQALQYYEEAERIYQQIKDSSGIGNILSNKALVYYNQGQYPKALTTNVSAIRIGEALKDTLLRASGFNNIASIYAKQGDISQAMNFYQQALLFHKYKKNRQGVAYTQDNIAGMLKDKGDFTQALAYLEEALKTFKEINDKRGIAGITNNIGDIYLKQVKFAQAIKYCRDALGIWQTLEDKHGMAKSFILIATAYKKIGLFENALNHALQSYQLAQEVGIRYIIKESSQQLAEIYSYQRDYQKAFEYYQIYDIAKDSLFNQESLRQLTEMRTKYQAQVKEQEINNLKIEQRARDAELQQKNIINYALISILLISLLLSGLVFYNYKDKQKANVALERKNAELNETLVQLKSAQSQLIHSEKMASLGQLTAGIAHEINNPLNFVYAGIGALEHSLAGFYDITDELQNLMKEEDREKLIEYIMRFKQIRSLKEYDEIKNDLNALVKDIKIGAVRTTDIVKGLRNFSRLDEGKPKYGDIHNDLDAALMLLRSKLVKNITVAKKYGEKIPEIPALHGQLNQVFTNIIANALQAMGELGGKLTLITRMGILNNKPCVVIAIRDTGIGMPDEVKAKIFEPFFTTKDVGEGTGLGLSISYGIIQNHNGTIEVHSEIGKGTEFMISLPTTLEGM